MISSFIASILLWKKVSSAMAVAGAGRRLCLDLRGFKVLGDIEALTRLVEL
jgi:hypothetical protein